MSRGVKGLRQLISETRQVHANESSSEDEQANNDDIYCQATDALTSQIASVSVSSPYVKHGSHVGLMTDNDCTTSTSFFQRLPSADSAATVCQLLQLPYNNPRPLSDLGYHPECQLHKLPKYQPLPAVISDCWAAKSTTSCQHIDKETASTDSTDSGFITSDSPALSDKHKTVEELDVVLQLFDRSVVLVWLEQTKRSITDISDWCAEDENFIRFSHFWLLEFPSDRRHSMFELEYGLLRDKIASGCRNEQPSSEQLESFLSAVLHEFPEGQLTGLADAYVFLGHLEALAERQKRESLLAAVSYSLHNQQHYDCLLAVRTYAIVTIWSAVLDQYRSGMDSAMASQRKKSTRPSTAHGRSVRPSSARLQSARSFRPSTANSRSRSELKSLEDEMAATADISSQKRLFDAVRLGFEDVVKYLLETQRVSVDLRDASNKTTIFHAVTSSQTPVLRYLLSQCTQSGCTSLVNVSADSGNTPLHAAVNRGDVAVVRELLNSSSINVDAVNHECGDATPLLLAAMHGHIDIAELLLNAGADVSRTMSGKTAREIAVDFDNLDIADLIDHLTV